MVTSGYNDAICGVGLLVTLKSTQSKTRAQNYGKRIMSKTTDADLFISPGVNLQSGDEHLDVMVNLSAEALKDRWDTEEGISILSSWKASGFERSVLDKLVGRYYDHTDIRGISLAKETLKKVDLNSVDLYRANLESATFHEVNLKNSWLSEANIKGASFEWVDMTGVLVDNADFDHETKFSGVNLNSINFTLAALLQDVVVGQQRIEHLERRYPMFALFLKLTCDYGRSFGRFLVCSISIIILFGVIYKLFPGSINVDDLGSSMYFSVVTFTTLGYGDLFPVSALGKVIVIIEVLLGYIMIGLLVAILSRRIIGK